MRLSSALCCQLSFSFGTEWRPGHKLESENSERMSQGTVAHMRGNTNATTTKYFLKFSFCEQDFFEFAKLFRNRCTLGNISSFYHVQVLCNLIISNVIESGNRN